MLFIVNFLQTSLLAIFIKNLRVASQLSKSLFRVESAINSAELPYRVRCQFKSFSMHICFNSLVVRAFTEGHPANHSIGKHAHNWTFYVCLELIDIVISIFPGSRVWLCFARKQFSLSFFRCLLVECAFLFLELQMTPNLQFCFVLSDC